MNTRGGYENRSLMKLNKRGLRGAFALLLLLPVAARAGGVVTNCTEAALRAAMTGGGVVTFACDGTIALSSPLDISTDTVLDATNRNVTISGNNSVRLVYVATNVSLTILNLALANGLSTNGGALFNAGGSVNATNCLFTGNRAAGSDGTTNAPNGLNGAGGAVCNAGSFNASQCTFVLNAAQGGRGADGISVAVAQPPPAGNGGWGAGGALCNLGLATLERSLFASNSVVGGSGGAGSAANQYQFPGSETTFGGQGGAGAGGALYNAGAAVLVNCTLAANGGNGGNGGAGGDLTGPGFPRGPRFGAPGGGGGAGVGGIYATNGVLALTNTTIASNVGSGGNGGRGGASGTYPGYGGDGGMGVGGMHNEPSAPPLLVNSIVASNSGIGGSGGYGCRDTGQSVDCGDGPSGASVAECSGSVFDLGHNLSSDWCFTDATSFNQTDPKLGPLADNGGPTLTMALLPGSPAIDAGDTSLAPPTDQRGFPRPFGAAADIGAFEYSARDIVPTVASQPASAVTGTNATLNGTVNPNGSSTAAWFQWGTTANYGNLTAMTDMGSGTNALALSVPLAGLTPGVTYHFRVAATNTYGTVFGTDQAFATLGPPQVWTWSATAVGTNAATLNGTVNPDGYPTAAWFQWGTTTNFGNLTSVTDVGSGTTTLPLSVPLAGLSPGVTYHFRVAATNSNGTVYGSDQSFPTLGLGPPQVWTLSATAVTAKSATLNGAVNPMALPTAAWFEWGNTANYGNLTPVTDMGSGTNDLPLSGPLAGLTPGVTYHFHVAATNSAGAVYGSDQAFTTLAVPQVWTLSATAITTNGATLDGTVNPNGSSTAAWFQWGTTINYGNLTPVTDMGSGTNALALSVPLAGLSPGVTYHFRVAATNTYGAVYGSDQAFIASAHPVHYVSPESTNPTPPYANWATAATNIQQAVGAAEPNDVVMVTNGFYTGSAPNGGTGWPFVDVETPLTLLSVNGPQFTVIDGGGTNQCVSLTGGASLRGFTLTNGWGGVSCTSTNAHLTNCVMTGNSQFGVDRCTLYNCTLSGNSGSGAWYCTLYDCTLSGNSGGGAYESTLYGCTLTCNLVNNPYTRGGGAGACTLYNCTLSGNSVGQCGGGAADSTLYNCTLTGNSAVGFEWVYPPPTGPMHVPGHGGGVCNSALYNCRLVGNFCDGSGGGASSDQTGTGVPSTLYNCTLTGNWANGGGGGASGSTLYNSIVYDNCIGCTLSYCCTTPDLGGVGNITNAPLFLDYANGNLRLQSNSPCINAGNNAYVTTATDLDGRPRIVGGTVDMGAYEFQPGVSGVFIGWLQQYGLPTDGSADYADPDHDGMNDWQEWVCGTDPTNALSVLRMVFALPTSTNATVKWQSVAGVNYFVERSTNLTSPFSLLATNILGQAGATGYADTNAGGAGPFFYRVGVSPP